ncbi:MAG: hypothetical protein GF401_00455 [Chitinivibrionales bacterium]|nr:hypothetical protein [Chitinivibrionales bacterium]
MSQLQIAINAEQLSSPLIIDSTDFFTCPEENDTCDRRDYYEEIQGYTQKVPMTSHASYKYVITEADGSATMHISLVDSTDTLLSETIWADPIKKYTFFLIYLGYKYAEDVNAIAEFNTCFDGDLAHYAFEINGTVSNNDSLYIVWIE